MSLNSMPFRQRPVEGHLHDRLYWYAKLKASGRVNWRFSTDDNALKPVIVCQGCSMPSVHWPWLFCVLNCPSNNMNSDNRIDRRPFFAYFSFYDVHTPLMAREDLRKKYEQKRMQLGLTEKWGREHERDVRLVQEHAVYAAMVEAMDLAVGKVLAKLDELGLSDNTIVIFTSDNGGLSTSEG